MIARSRQIACTWRIHAAIATARLTVNIDDFVSLQQIANLFSVGNALIIHMFICAMLLETVPVPCASFVIMMLWEMVIW